MVQEVADMAAIVQPEAGGEGISARVLAVLERVPRHRFVPQHLSLHAYDNRPLPIGHDQTISQPYIVGLMTELLGVQPGARILEVGTGSGYQAAVLAESGASVWSVEIVEPLAARAAATLQALGYDTVAVKVGDGYAGWPEHAPFDGIIVTAGAAHVPQPLLDQLKPGGRMVIPVGAPYAVQQLWLIEKSGDGHSHRKRVTEVRFVPLTGGH
ncbi:MAG: protein-L-isoaspartate(D-aspartate) O-methyltransferase [Methylobacterium sp.]|nr:protein-L-isoaspartate(D-aspartate) O-methyltransferase [Methylobacterium sp.]